MKSFQAKQQKLCICFCSQRDLGTDSVGLSLPPLTIIMLINLIIAESAVADEPSRRRRREEENLAAAATADSAAEIILFARAKFGEFSKRAPFLARACVRPGCPDQSTL